MAQSNPEIKTGGRCPICRRPSDSHYRPFCSRRCSDVDLARWLGGGYAIPGGQADADEDGDDALIVPSHHQPPKDGSDEDA